jgi:hypothetical protein
MYSITVSLTNRFELYSRRVYSLSDVAGEIGGLFTAIKGLFLLPLFFINIWTQDLSMVNHNLEYKDK